MYDDSAFLNSIPKFLRRSAERLTPVRQLAFPGRVPAAPSHRPERAIHGGQPPVQPDFTAQPALATVMVTSNSDRTKPAPGVAQWPGAPRRVTPLPWFAREVAGIRAPTPLPALMSEAPETEVVDLTAHRDASTQADGATQRMQTAVQRAFDAETDFGDDDVAFQVTLPRSVIRQIRVIAAAEGTTHRAIVLRALREAGVEVPDGADVDRRAAAAKRRQQA